MSDQPHIENGFASVNRGAWLIRRGQPAAVCGFLRVRGMRGFLVPDRHLLHVAETEGALHLSCAARPFLTQVTVTDQLNVVSAKLLVAPAGARAGAHILRVIPLSFRRSFPVTQLKSDWAVLATRSRVRRLVLGEDEVMTVRAESAVAWTGQAPTGFVPKLSLRQLLLPRRAATGLSLNFYGPQIIWVEGCDEF